MHLYAILTQYYLAKSWERLEHTTKSSPQSFFRQFFLVLNYQNRIEKVGANEVGIILLTVCLINNCCLVVTTRRNFCYTNIGCLTYLNQMKTPQ